MTRDWRSYDSAAAACHDGLAVRIYFAAPAVDLVARTDVQSAATILDVGTGSGIAALLAQSAAKPDVVVAGIDPSVEILRLAQRHGIRHAVAGAVPGLPYPKGSFDRVLANFVLGHLSSLELGLADMVRVLKPGGRLGVTAWGSRQYPYGQLWQSVAESFIDQDLLAEAQRTALPWEDWLMEPEHLGQALTGAGLVRVEIHRVWYRICVTIAEFLAVRESSLQARFMRHTLHAEEWERFRQTVSAEFCRRCEDPIDHKRDVLIAVGALA